MSKIAEAVARKQTQLPQYEYLWRAELPSLGVSPMTMMLPPEIVNNAAPEMIGGYPFELIKEPLVESVLDELNHRVYSIDAPMPSIDTKKNTVGSKYFYTASHSDIGNISMRLDEYEDALTLAYLETWRKMIKRSDGFTNPPAYYKRDIRVIRMTSTDLDTHITTYKNYFPTEVSPIGYTYESTGIMQYSVSFTGDDVEHIIIPAAQIKQLVEAIQETIKNGYMTTEFMPSRLMGLLQSSPLLRGIIGQLPIGLTTYKRLVPLINKVFKFY